MSVVQLIPNIAIAADNEQIACRLELLAARIRANEFGALERAAVLLDSAVTGVATLTYGRPTTNMDLLGLLEYAKHHILHPPTPEA